MQSYDHKAPAYFNRARMDILPLLPAFSESVLEVGCGNGATLAYLKHQAYCGRTYGLELLESVAEEARKQVDYITIGDAEKILPQWEAKQFDLILCLDVIEHLLDPWAFIDQAARLLKPEGVLIASIPNIRTASVIGKLLFKGTFDYQDAGIMDRTHLRFFTRKSAMELMNRKPLQLERFLFSPLPPGSKSQIANAITLNVFRELFAEQFLIRSKHNK
jgi:2-polyprenyl-3-methyl-5-hydroxy-6-metoxy-1,4-benzoquinol methylase